MRIEELRRSKEDRRQLELKFGDVVIAESRSGGGFLPSSSVKPHLATSVSEVLC